MNLSNLMEMKASDVQRFLERNFPINNLAHSKRNYESIFGVNDATYVVAKTVDGKIVKCPAYSCWSSMISRCCNERTKERKPTYSEIYVCDEWRYFSSFLSWWKSNQVDGWQIDKDLTSDSGIYSPDTCVFVPGWLNKFTSSSKAKRGNLKIGVYLCKQTGKFRAKCGNPISGKVESIGRFSSEDEAHLSWMKRKKEIALDLKGAMDSIDNRIYQRVIKIIDGAN